MIFPASGPGHCSTLRHRSSLPLPRALAPALHHPLPHLSSPSAAYGYRPSRSILSAALLRPPSSTHLPRCPLLWRSLTPCLCPTLVHTSTTEETKKRRSMGSTRDAEPSRPAPLAAHASRCRSTQARSVSRPRARYAAASPSSSVPIPPPPPPPQSTLPRLVLPQCLVPCRVLSCMFASRVSHLLLL